MCEDVGFLIDLPSHTQHVACWCILGWGVQQCGCVSGLRKQRRMEAVLHPVCLRDLTENLSLRACALYKQTVRGPSSSFFAGTCKKQPQLPSASCLGKMLWVRTSQDQGLALDLGKQWAKNLISHHQVWEKPWNQCPIVNMKGLVGATEL